MVTKESIEKTFDKMNGNGINIKKQLLYGYFFTNKTKAKLMEFSKILVEKDYKLVDIYENGDTWWLWMEKVEIHTPETLYQRCYEFYSLVKEFKFISFDGYDVGNPNKNKPITDVK